jgi:hypothetical protein
MEEIRKVFTAGEESRKEQIVGKIISEARLCIANQILQGIYSYDGRFDVDHVIHLEDIIQTVLSAKISEIFIKDVVDEI